MIEEELDDSKWAEGETGHLWIIRGKNTFFKSCTRQDFLFKKIHPSYQPTSQSGATAENRLH